MYKSNKKWHTHAFVVFFLESDSFNIAFVSSKKVGNAVQRNRARRVLRAIILEKENQLRTGKYVLVAKNNIFERKHKVLKNDFNYVMKKLNLFK
ncbi:ribonuclease P protein component [Arcobacter sp. 15-2]|uniref:ribonuclease P protein component n=1 Tax=Arcobacter sp. 15-2 TaxID=3374109 RepID=UPI00399CBA06